MKPIQAAIIGAGAIHGCHAEPIRQHPDARLLALVDTDIDKAQTLAQHYGCRYYRGYREMLADTDINVVHICTPHHTHQEMIVAALAAGKHVFCEKPIGINETELTQIQAALAQADTQLAVCYQNRLNPTSQRIYQLIQQQTLGRMLSIKAHLTWSRQREYYASSPWRGRWATEGGSLLINQAIHTLDLMQWFAGGVKRIKGLVESTLLEADIETEDTAMATMELANGARGLFYATNCYTTDSPLFLEIHFENGFLQLERNTLWQVSNEQRLALVNDELPQGGAKRYWGDSHRQAIGDFYAGLLDPTQPGGIGINDAAISLRMVNALYRSAQLRRWVDISS
jgi:Predicted dehydrogenases and related proteins